LRGREGGRAGGHEGGGGLGHWREVVVRADGGKVGHAVAVAVAAAAVAEVAADLLGGQLGIEAVRVALLAVCALLRRQVALVLDHVLVRVVAELSRRELLLQDLVGVGGGQGEAGEREVADGRELRGREPRFGKLLQRSVSVKCGDE